VSNFCNVKSMVAMALDHVSLAPESLQAHT
jgi:hypothetical protein